MDKKIVSNAFNPKQVGKHIAFGGSSRVYLYGKTQVLKKSFLSPVLGKLYQQKIKSNYILCKKYFSDFVVDTQFVTHKNHQLEIQSLIAGNPLSKKHLTEPKYSKDENFHHNFKIHLSLEYKLLSLTVNGIMGHGP